MAVGPVCCIGIAIVEYPSQSTDARSNFVYCGLKLSELRGLFDWLVTVIKEMKGRLCVEIAEIFGTDVCIGGFLA